MNRKSVNFIALVALLTASSSCWAVKVSDITRIYGQRPNFLTGLGLVVGLKGSGDGGNYAPAINPLREMLAKFSDPVSAKELQSAANVAIVTLTAVVPPNGVREGDRIDVQVTSNGAATTLKGGRLFVTPLTGPIPGSGIFAMAQGPIILEDPTTPTTGVVEGGAVMEADLPAKYIENGRFTLVLDDASATWTTASNIAKVINDSQSDNGEVLAVTVDPKNVVITIPQAELEHPDSFISRVQQLPVPMQAATEARVQINERTGTMIVTGDVEISPVVISHNGLTISTVDPKPVPTQRTPVVTTKDIVSLDTTNQGGARLQDLVSALEQLKVPAQDRITIIKRLHKSGKLHAKLIVE